MKYLFVLVTLLAVSAPSAHAAGTTDLLAQLAAIEARLLELQAASLAPQPEVAGVDFDTEVVSASTGKTLTITIGDGTILQNVVSSRAEAQTLCESIAYNTTYMWLQVTCDLDGTILYDDVFIAG